MTPEVAIAAISAITAMVLGMFRLFVELRSARRALDGRLTELLDLTRVAANAEGRLAGERIGKLTLEPPYTINKGNQSSLSSESDRPG